MVKIKREAKVHEGGDQKMNMKMSLDWKWRVYGDDGDDGDDVDAIEMRATRGWTEAVEVGKNWAKINGEARKTKAQFIIELRENRSGVEIFTEFSFYHKLFPPPDNTVDVRKHAPSGLIENELRT